MNFKTFFMISEAVEIRQIDPEEDWDDADKAEAIATISGIGLDKEKKPRLIAYDEKGEVVGAAFTKANKDAEFSDYYGEPVHRYEFDVVVHPKARGNDLVGIKLIRAAEEDKRKYEAQNGRTFSRLWVVNPQLARLLQSPKFGYEAESEHSDGTAHLLKW